jgi:pyruvate-formate lyase-activating enzyme
MSVKSVPLARPFLSGLRRLPVIKSWSERRGIERRYEEILREPWEPRLYSDTDELHIGEIEINKNCNLNCAMCNTDLSTRPQMNMELDLFERAVLFAKSMKRPRTSLHTIGEPLLNPRLPQYFEILRKHGVEVFISTNALLLEKRLDLLIENADLIYDLRFSIDGASKETFEKIRVRGQWERLIRNLDYFRERTKDLQPFRQLRISSIVSEDVRHELARHLDFFSRYVPMRNIDLNLVGGLSPDNTYFLTRSILKNHIVPWPPCDQLFSSTMHVLNDGRVTACCRDYNGDLVYGSLRDGAPAELINNENVLELRRQHLENRIPKESLCASCFRVDPRVSKSFKLFVSALVGRFSKTWDVPRMQDRFEEFFTLFSRGIPDSDTFSDLLRR